MEWRFAADRLPHVAAEQRGATIKKKLEIDPIHADTVRLIYRLALNGDGDSGPMGIKSITTYLNDRDIRTGDGGRWGIASVNQILTRTTYVSQHRFNTRDHKTRTATGLGRPREQWTRSRCVGENVRTYAELLRSEMERRQLKFTPIDWSE